MADRLLRLPQRVEQALLLFERKGQLVSLREAARAMLSELTVA